MNDSNPLVRTSALSLTLRGHPILSEIDLEISRGDYVGLIGPNGAGKSMLLKLLLGLIPPTAGTVQLFGGPPHRGYGRIGYVPQTTVKDLTFPLTVTELVTMGRLPFRHGKNVSRRSDAEAIDQSLDKVGLADLAEIQIDKLSGGQLQRAYIARALAVEPSLLFLDEPTASLDSHSGLQVYELLRELAGQGVGILLVSHDIGVISAYVKTIACLNRRLHYHHTKEIPSGVLEELYGCPVELIAHGTAHRVLHSHPPGGSSE